jgi:uncharacterized membrane protein YhaH (DUF805 family)
MNLISQIKAFFQNAGNIKIPTNRKDFWIQFIIYFVFSSIFATLSSFIQLIPNLGILIHYFLLIYIQFAFITLSIRRLHDAGYSGWWTVLWAFGMLSIKTLVKDHMNLGDQAMLAGNIFVILFFVPIIILWSLKSKASNNKYIKNLN